MSADNDKYYLNIGRASDLPKGRDYFIYRVLEIFPGALIWLTFSGMVILSFFYPAIAAYSVIALSVYWIFRAVHFSIHLISAYSKMKKNLRTNWVEKLDKLAEKNPDKNWRDIYHLVVFPAYKENLKVIRESFLSLTNSGYSKEKIIAVLAVEERAGASSQETAQAIQREFSDKLYKFLITCHPDGLKGEIAGKGSNISWAGREAKERIIDPLKIPYEKIIVSCFDADTQIFPDYFYCLTHYYLISPDSCRTSFQPIPLYLNNFWQANFFSRLVASCNVFWEMMQQQRPEKLVTFSSHSMSFKALAEINFWQVNVVSEDAGIFWKSFLFYDGNYKIIPLHYPVSMDCVAGATFKEAIINQYKQQRRWAFGSEGMPYLFFGFLKNKKISLQKKIRYAFLIIEGFWAWGTMAFLIFFLGWLPLLLGGAKFKNTVLAYNLPGITSNLMTVAMVGLVVCIIINTLLMIPRPKNYSRWKSLLILSQWIFFPLTFIFFGALPAVEAQTRLMLGKYLGFYAIKKTR